MACKVELLITFRYMQCSRMFLTFCLDLKNALLSFLEIRCQKVISKSLVLSPSNEFLTLLITTIKVEFGSRAIAKCEHGCVCTITLNGQVGLQKLIFKNTNRYRMGK